tara:strand:+ start:374 stop:730 length:357 start_codon:yes stop_codon:yes gene_type:complete
MTQAHQEAQRQLAWLQQADAEIHAARDGTATAADAARQHREATEKWAKGVEEEATRDKKAAETAEADFAAAKVRDIRAGEEAAAGQAAAWQESAKRCACRILWSPRSLDGPALRRTCC